MEENPQSQLHHTTHSDLLLFADHCEKYLKDNDNAKSNIERTFLVLSSWIARLGPATTAREMLISPVASSFAFRQFLKC